MGHTLQGDNSVFASGQETLSQALGAAKGLKFLSLAQNPVSAATLTDLLSSLSLSPSKHSLTCLDLSSLSGGVESGNYRAWNQAVSGLKDFLTSVTTVAGKLGFDLRLRDWGEGEFHLSTMLESCLQDASCSLTSLDVSFADVDMHRLFGALETNRTLKKLVAIGNGYNSEFLSNLSDILKKNCVISEINVDSMTSLSDPINLIDFVHNPDGFQRDST